MPDDPKTLWGKLPGWSRWHMVESPGMAPCGKAAPAESAGDWQRTDDPGDDACRTCLFILNRPWDSPLEHRADYMRKWRRRDYQRRVQAQRKPCLPGRTNHRYDPDGLCIHCGAARL